MPAKLLHLCVLPVMLLASFPAVADIVELAPVQDNSLYEDDAGGLSNGAGAKLFMGRTGEGGGEKLRRALVKFDLSSLPLSAVIDSVELSFTIDQVPQITAVPGVATLHAVTADWGEAGSNAPGNEGTGTSAQSGDATWLHRFYDDVFWAAPGGDFDPLPSASTNFGNSNPEQLVFASTPELVADVQHWLRNPAENHGWMLRGDEVTVQNARRVGSRESTSTPAPALKIEFTVPSVFDDLSLVEVSAALSNPIGVVNAGDGSGRLFIVEQEGLIRIYDTQTQTLFATPFLDIRDEVFSKYDAGGFEEQGLLGLAFHPQYASNGRFFVNYTASPSIGVYRTIVAEFLVSGDPDVAMEIGQTVLEFSQESRNHNGGDLKFGPDGYLYIASGDGGGANDQFDNAQNPDTLKGAILRIDVDSDPQPGAELCGLVSDYGIPEGNAFPGGDDGCDELLHIGLRNPWRISFDAQSGDLWIADVGQGAWEEINLVPAGTEPRNFGWPCFEGTHVFDPQAVCPAPLTAPVIEYSHADGNCSVTGGYLYRGGRLPLEGQYLYGDWCSSRVWAAHARNGGWVSEEWEAANAVLSSVASFGQDENCELYIADRDGQKLFRIEDGEQVFRSGMERRDCR